METPTTPQRHQQWARQALRDRLQLETPESPRRRRCPPRAVPFSLPAQSSNQGLLSGNRDVFDTPRQPEISQGQIQVPTPGPTGGQAVLPPSRRALAQQRRRQRERERNAGAVGHATPPTPMPQQHQHAQQPMPPATHAGTVSRRSRNQGRVSPFNLARQPYDDSLPRHDLGRMDVVCSHCQALHWIDEKLASLSVSSPKFGESCCSGGKISVPLLATPPPPLLQLYTSEDPLARSFRQDLWKYNRALAFTSLGVAEDHSVNGGRGEPIFRISGELCHWSGALLAGNGQCPRYSQVYMYDPLAALDSRMSLNDTLNRNIMQTLQNVLNEHHRYVPIYRHAYEIMKDREIENIEIRLCVLPQNDQRRYNLPTVDEVAMVLPGTTIAPEPRDIVLRLRSGGLHRVSELHPAYSPLQYPLLFCHGENGWHPDLKDRAGKRLTMTRFVTFLIQTRRGNAKSVLHLAGRLFCRWLVDMFAAADQNRLRYLAGNQSKLRAALYSGFQDAVNQLDENLDLNNIGQRVVLPSSYVGGPRYMGQCFQDSMALARFYRKVDLFVTMTTNPEWVEIQRELFPGQTAYDRPDLVARVFNLKRRALMDYIYKEGFFGAVASYVYTIEFQKRGLPHMHCLIFLEEPYKLQSTQAVDACISAEWPDPVMQPKLFDTVKRCMVHGPCGVHNPRAPCMKDGKCSKGYPKAFQDFTATDGNGYPLYARRNNGQQYEVRGVMLDNRSIVPYSPKLLLRFDCHINVECAISLGSFKYIFKYIQKGPDLATLCVDQPNEIQQFIDGRYISAPVAAWRLAHFDIHEQIPNVVRLQVHLPGHHMVTFNPDLPPSTIQERAAQEKTSLTAFFAANADPVLGPEAQKYTYQEFPQHFTWLEATGHWKLCQRGFAIGRMFTVPPTGGERFYLRTLLTVVKGPKSFDDLRTYNGVTYPTFHAACVARGLLEDDGEWDQCLSEACDMQVGERLRRLFVTIMIFCVPSQPERLWEKYWHSICDDLPYRLQSMGRTDHTDDEVQDYGLYLLSKLLQDSGHSLDDWTSMPKPVNDWSILEQYTNRLIAEQLDYNRANEQSRLNMQFPLLNPEQRHAYQMVTASVNDQVGRLFFLNGPGGTGKTFLYNCICNYVRSKGLIALCVASSGIAALLIQGGRTAHSMFKIPIEGLSSESFCSITKESQRGDLIRLTRLIIWDEIGAQHRHAPEAVDHTCRDLRDDNRPFGGITVVFGGDFQQTLPVVQRGSKKEIVDATLQKSYLWEDIHLLKLHQNMRLESADDAARSFASWLLDVGHGRNTLPTGEIDIPAEMISPDESSLINAIYPGVDSNPPPPAEFFLNRMILAARNADVSVVNEKILEKMAGSVVTYIAADSVINESGASSRHAMNIPIPTEFLQTVNAPGLPPGELLLKVGCPLILLRNLSAQNGLCNGTRMVVTRLGRTVIEVQLIGGDHNGEKAFIPRISLIPSSQSTDLTFSFKRRQFPVRLAFALTINKAQGQSVKYVGLDLRTPVFSHGQLYVGFSRATSPHRIKVLLGDRAELLHSHATNKHYTQNIVYPEVLFD